MDGDGPPHHSRRNAAGDVLGRSPGWALSRKRGAEAARLRDRTDQHRRRHGKSEGRIESRVRHRRAEVIGRFVRASSFIEEISMKRCVCLAVLALLAFVSFHVAELPFLQMRVLGDDVGTEDVSEGARAALKKPSVGRHSTYAIEVRARPDNVQYGLNSTLVTSTSKTRRTAKATAT